MLTSALIYLCAAVLSVPIAKRLGLGSVLGYLLSGVIIGPSVLHLVGDQTDVMHVAEFGVVMMLFLVGLELRPGRLWQLRRSILGLGGSQVLLTTFAIALILLPTAGLPWYTSVAIGLTLALSSTAIVVQSLSERGLLKTQAGSNIFSVLLLQDIAVIPIMAVLPLLAVSGNQSASGSYQSLIGDFPIWLQVIITLTTIIAIVIGGKYLSTPVFRLIADTRLREIFTVFALLIVVLAAVLMQTIGMSPALGTFLAGVVLAESEFRHELEVDIEPFKGILLGLFFITVGAGIDFDLVIEQPKIIILSVLGLIAIKAAVLTLIARIFKMPARHGLLFALSLAQGGEFAFVLVAASRQFYVFDVQTGNLLIVITAISMLVSPLLLFIYEMFLSAPDQKPDTEADKDISPTCQVIIAGYGRFGQIIGRLLRAQGYHLTILDHSPSQIDLVRRFGNKVYYGDASRRDLLAAAGAEDARILVVAVDEPDKTLEIVETAKKTFSTFKNTGKGDRPSSCL